VKKIVLVEDNPDNRLLILAILNRLYEVAEYETGSEALAGMAQERPDLVLLDISLPGMDGGEVLEKIRADEKLRDLPVVALTAHAMVGDREKLLGLGFDGYIAKPIVDEALLPGIIGKLIHGED
jgi:CheY-like chemotaxis protein